MSIQSNTSSLETITEVGGHLVLVKRGEKRPVWARWQERKPSLDVVAAHAGRLGLIPSSIGATALDVDHGDPAELPTPWTQYRTQRRNGRHFYYGDDEKRGNQNWQAAGCSGEVRSAKGYLILHPGGAKKIALALDSGVQLNLFPFPAELLQSHEAELIVPTVRQLHAVEPHGKASTRLEGVYPGARNESLFLVARLWAYKQRRGSDLGAWCRRVLDFTLECNNRLPMPLGEREAAATAYSVSTWVWSAMNEVIPAKGNGPLDHTSIAQSWRGTWSGESRRRKTHERDRTMIQAVESGRSLRDVAREFGLSYYAVWNIVNREGDL